MDTFTEKMAEARVARIALLEAMAADYRLAGDHVSATNCAAKATELRIQASPALAALLTYLAVERYEGRMTGEQVSEQIAQYFRNGGR